VLIVAEHVKKVHKVPTSTTTITNFLKARMRRT
jgi:predicted small metal-binding protein